GGISKIRCLSARTFPDVEIEIQISEYGYKEPLWRYSLGIKQEVRGYRLPYLSHEKVWKGNDLIVNRPEKDDKNDRERLTQTYLEQIRSEERRVGKECGCRWEA